MTNLDWLLFWGIMIALILFCLVSVKDVWSILRSMYRRTVNALKWHPYLPYLGVGMEQKKKHQNLNLNEEAGTYHVNHQKIFPRSRRTT